MQATETYTDLPVQPRTPYRIIVGNNPVNLVDPWGLSEITVWPIPFTENKCSECDKEELNECIDFAHRGRTGEWEDACVKWAESMDFYDARECETQVARMLWCYYKHCRIVDCDSGECKLESTEK